MSEIHKDMLGRPVRIGDYVVSYNNIYQVTALLGYADLVRILLIDKSKTTKSVKRPAAECCIVDGNDIIVWKLSRGY